MVRFYHEHRLIQIGVVQKDSCTFCTSMRVNYPVIKLQKIASDLLVFKRDPYFGFVSHVSEVIDSENVQDPFCF